MTKGGFPALPAQPAWLLRLPAIRAELARLSTPVLDRAAIEVVFGVGRRRAIDLLHQFGGYLAGKTFLVERTSLLRQLAALEAGEGLARERARRQRVSEELGRARAAVQARAVAIPAPRPGAGLPPGVHLRPGELRIGFEGADDLLRQLLELAMVIQEDHSRFKALCEE